MPQKRVGWQPSRFLTDRAEAERAYALAEQLAASMPPPNSWAPPGRRCARRSPATAGVGRRRCSASHCCKPPSVAAYRPASWSAHSVGAGVSVRYGRRSWHSSRRTGRLSSPWSGRGGSALAEPSQCRGSRRHHWCRRRLLARPARTSGGVGAVRSAPCPRRRRPARPAPRPGRHGSCAGPRTVSGGNPGIPSGATEGGHGGRQEAPTGPATSRPRRRIRSVGYLSARFHRIGLALGAT
jgi:hypothetical protein